MSWIDKIQNKPREQKIRIVWATIILATLILVVLWVLTSRISSNMPKDTTLFNTIGQGIKNIKDNYGKK